RRELERMRANERVDLVQAPDLARDLETFAELAFHAGAQRAIVRSSRGAGRWWRKREDSPRERTWMFETHAALCARALAMGRCRASLAPGDDRGRRGETPERSRLGARRDDARKLDAASRIDRRGRPQDILRTRRENAEERAERRESRAHSRRQFASRAASCLAAPVRLAVEVRDDRRHVRLAGTVPLLAAVARGCAPA